MYRFYVSSNQLSEETAWIEGSDVNHIRNVLRMKEDERLIVCDGEGMDYYCQISGITPERIDLIIEGKKHSNSELTSRLILFQALPKADKMEWIVQKAVELGAYAIVPVETKRCVVRLKEDKKRDKKRERWQTIAEAAAKQSSRGIIPQVLPVMDFAQALTYASELAYNLIPYELAEGMEESRRRLLEATNAESVGIFIGPEGGFEEEEVRKAEAMGARVVSLGSRILRTETAGMTVLSYLMLQI